MRLYASALAGWVNPADAFAQLYLDEPNSFWFDRETHPTNRFSIIGAGAVAHWLPEDQAIPWLRARIAELAEIDVSAAGDLPFDWRPGIAGLFEYEGSAAFLEVDRALVFDHANRKMSFVGIFASREDYEHWHHAALLRLALVGGRLAAHMHASKNPADAPGKARSRLTHKPADYLQLIHKAQQHIQAGDVYQLCLTNRLTVDSNRDAFAVFNELRAKNPAPFGAFLRLARPDGQLVEVVGSSPEEFLSSTAAGVVTTKPIKGTRPRVRRSDGVIDQVADALMVEELRQNPKERAENLMIVDLMRNDLGRVAEVDSVEVTSLFAIESYATVHQLVSTVRARLRCGLTIADAIESAFPGGSMTGAPKSRAIELIAELEQLPRNVYSGITGWIGLDGASQWSMTIRTMVFESGQVTIGIGGGITIDSDPAAELEETRVKANALLRVLDAEDPWA